jgi:hypothetical protein
MATHDTQNVSYMRKDEHFLADGVWYLTVDCPIHGMIDEEVPWDDAKTPHHAGVIADQRHQDCQLKQSEQEMKVFAKGEIAAAQNEVERINGLLKQAREVYSNLEQGEGESDKLFSLRVEEAKNLVDVHTRGLEQTNKRLDQIRDQNSRPDAWKFGIHEPD